VQRKEWAFRYRGCNLENRLEKQNTKSKPKHQNTPEKSGRNNLLSLCRQISADIQSH